MKDKEKVLKIILKISFIPYLLLLLLGINSAIYGFSFFGTSTYGIEGFMDSITIYGFALVSIFPVIPVCLVYEIFYFIRYMVKKNKIENVDEDKNEDKKEE